MVEENEYAWVGDNFKMFLKESLERQRNDMMDSFSYMLLASISG